MDNPDKFLQKTKNNTALFRRSISLLKRLLFVWGQPRLQDTHRYINSSNPTGIRNAFLKLLSKLKLLSR